MSGMKRASAFAFIICITGLAGGCNPSAESDGVFDTSRLPRVAGGKEIFASAATTIYTAPDTVAHTAEAARKALAAIGWQSYVTTLTAQSDNPNLQTISFKKGQQALGVFITIAPAQGNATSVQYTAVALKTDLPFSKDATNIEYDPNTPQLALVTGETVDNTLNFYRKELATLGWSLWSDQLNTKQPADGPSGDLHERGAFAHYVNDKQPKVVLVLTLQRAEAGKFKVELKQWPIGILEASHQANLNRDNSAALVEVSHLPRLDGAKEDPARASTDRLIYSVPGSVATTIAATKKLLAADGWKPYVAPLEEQHATLLAFKKGPQGLSVSFTMTAGQADQSSVYYSPNRLNFALPFPDEATDIVFDENRPYLNCITAGTIDAILDFFRKQLGVSGWSPLSATDAAARWPNGNIDEKVANGALAYFIRGNQRPILLSL